MTGSNPVDANRSTHSPTSSLDLRIGEEQLNLLERLTNACAVSGDEGEVRTIVLESVRSLPTVSEVRVDALGSVLVTCRGSTPERMRVMVAAHMDEVGLMITSSADDGFFRFDKVGGLDERQLAGKQVLVGKDHIPGVIGAKPIHLSQSEERKRAISIDSMRIDVGPESAGRVKVGNWATFATKFTRIGDSIRAKALDDRLGVATLIELIRHAPPEVDLLAAFTVQEEVGLRGAQAAAYALDPQVAVVLDCTPANDLPPWDAGDEYSGENIRYNTRLDCGPALYVADRSTLTDPRLLRHFIRVASRSNIPYQIRQPGGGGTDAGSIHTQRAGIPAISISVPGRYLHTAASIARIQDWENTLRLVHAGLTELKPDLLAQSRQ